MATSKCFSLVRGRAMRATKLDGCGNVVLGPDSVVNTDGFITVGFTSNILEGEVIEITNAAGRVCISDKPSPTFVDYTIEITLCGVNPDLIHLLTGNPIVYNDEATPEGVGFQVNSDIDLDASGFALELWSGVPTDVCEGGSLQSYGYLLFPFVKGGVLGDFTVENGANNFTISGAASKDGTQWGVGPHDVLLTAAGAESPLLEALGTKNHLHMQLTTLAPPDDLCGASALGVPATSAVAGIPGTYLPANSYARLNLAAMTGLTASPNTNWTAGQYVTLRDGTKAHWNGTIWVAGAHP